MENWEQIYSTASLAHAEILKGMLNENNITVVLVNKKDSGYVVLGEVEIWVNKDDIVRALHLIKSAENE